MYGHWDANLLVIVATVLSVAASVLLHYEGLNLLSRWLGRRNGSHRRRRVLYGICGVLLLHVSEIWIFGTAIWALLQVDNTGSIAGVHPVGLLDAVYMAAATYTTVGFGDLAPVGPIRFIAGTMAVVGFVLIGWSASFTYLEMVRDWRDR